MFYRKTYAFLAVCTALICSCTSVTNDRHVTLYTAKKIISISTANDSVYTVNPAVAVDDSGRIAGVGDLATLQGRFSKNSLNTSFANDVIMPGFVEAHSHFQPNGMFATLPYTGYYTRPGITDSLQGITSSSAMISYLKTVVQQNPTLPLLANGADPIYFNGRRFTYATLDSVSKSIPILMQLGSGHIVICNSVMLGILRNDPQWNQLPAGTVVMNGGAPSGELDESAGVEFAFNVFNTLYGKANNGTTFFNLNRMSKAISDGGVIMNRAGITTATDLLFTGATKLEFIANRVIYNKAILEPNKFPVRVVLGYDGYTLSRLWGSSWLDSSITFLRTQKLLDNNSLRTGLVKFVLDGSIQGYTAQVSVPYLNPPGNPMWNVPPSQLATVMSPFIQAGFPVAIHTNGDAAIDTAIQALQSIQSKNKVTGIWATLEHAQMITPTQFTALSNMPGVGANLFVNHIYYYGREHALYTIGPTWVNNMANVKMADSLHIPYSVHSDAPVTPALPLFAAWVSINRVSAPLPAGQYSNYTFGTPISLQKALHAITIGAAQLLNMDSEIGSIDEGKWADFAILGADPLSATSGILLKDIPVKGTMKGGVYFDAAAGSGHKKK